MKIKSKIYDAIGSDSRMRDYKEKEVSPIKEKESFKDKIFSFTSKFKGKILTSRNILAAQSQ